MMDVFLVHLKFYGKVLTICLSHVTRLPPWNCPLVQNHFAMIFYEHKTSLILLCSSMTFLSYFYRNLSPLVMHYLMSSTIMKLDSIYLIYEYLIFYLFSEAMVWICSYVFSLFSSIYSWITCISLLIYAIL